MAYVPVQRDAGRIMYEGAMQRARTIGQGISGVTDFLYQQQQEQAAKAQAKAEEAKQFASKLKALESVLTTHKDKFKLSDEQLKQFLSVDPNESPKDRYLRVGGFIEGSLKASDLAKAQAEEAKIARETAMMGQPKGQVMTLEQFRNLPADIDAKAEPAPGDPTRVVVTGYNLRGPQAQKPSLVIPGDAITRVVDPNDPTKILATYENIKVGPGQRLVGAGGSEAPSAPPASLPQFLPSGSMLGGGAQPAPAAVPTAALAAMAPAQTGLRIENIPGGPAAKEAEEKARAEEVKSVRELNSAKNILSGIERIERNLDQTFMGIEPVGMYSGARKAVSQAAVNVAEGIDTIVANIGFDELRSLKDSGTSLGQVAIKELDNLQRLRGSLSQNLGKPEFKKTLNEFKAEAQRTIERLDYLNNAYKRGATALNEAQLKEYNKLGGTFSPTETQKIPWNSGKQPGQGTLGRSPAVDAGKFQGADRQAYEWLLRNPNDPRADAIRRKLGL